MRTFIENYLHFMKNCIRPHYEKLKPLKSGFIDNSSFENNRDPCLNRAEVKAMDPSLKMALVMNKGKKTAHLESWSKTGKLFASFIQRYLSI